MVASKTNSHPRFIEMINEAISTLKDRKGSSRAAIHKFVVDSYKIDEKMATIQLRRALKKGVEDDNLIQEGQRFKLTPKGKALKPPAKKPEAKKPAPKKPTVAKKKVVAKAKAEVKKSPVTKKAVATKKSTTTTKKATTGTKKTSTVAKKPTTNKKAPVKKVAAKPNAKGKKASK